MVETESSSEEGFNKVKLIKAGAYLNQQNNSIVCSLYTQHIKHAIVELVKAVAKTESSSEEDFNKVKLIKAGAHLNQQNSIVCSLYTQHIKHAIVELVKAVAEK